MPSPLSWLVRRRRGSGVRDVLRFHVVVAAQREVSRRSWGARTPTDALSACVPRFDRKPHTPHCTPPRSVERRSTSRCRSEHSSLQQGAHDVIGALPAHCLTIWQPIVQQTPRYGDARGIWVRDACKSMACTLHAIWRNKRVCPECGPAARWVRSGISWPGTTLPQGRTTWSAPTRGVLGFASWRQRGSCQLQVLTGRGGGGQALAIASRSGPTAAG